MAPAKPSRECLAYQRDTYTNVTGRDLDLARTNIASGVKEDDFKPIKDLLKMATVVRRTSPRRTCTTLP